MKYSGGLNLVDQQNGAFSRFKLGKCLHIKVKWSDVSDWLIKIDGLQSHQIKFHAKFSYSTAHT